LKDGVLTLVWDLIFDLNKRNMKKTRVLILMSVLITFTCYGQNKATMSIPEAAEDICPILVGEKLPNASLQNTEGNLEKLHDFISQKPSVLVFYRGGWCPYCNNQLSGLAEIENSVLDLGYQIIAISPDDYQNLQITQTKDDIQYRLFSDPNANLIQQIGIGFKTPNSLVPFIENKNQKGAVTNVLPVPTVMILNQEGVILFEYMNPNYKQRISGEMLLAVLKTLQ
jgi:peroxiredoxin